MVHSALLLCVFSSAVASPRRRATPLPPPGVKAPAWSVMAAPDTSAPYCGFEAIDNSSVHYSEVYHGVPAVGTYSHAVMMDWHDGNLLLTWKVSPVDEDSPGQRILWSQSTDGISWTPTDGTNEIFPNVSTTANPAALFAGPSAILNGRRYATATPHQFCLFPFPWDKSLLLMRRVLPGIGNFGALFWAASKVPVGFEEASKLQGISTLADMDAEVQEDLALLWDTTKLPCSTNGTLKCEACLNGCDYAPGQKELGLGGSGEYAVYNVPGTEESIVLHRDAHVQGFTHRSDPTAAWSPQYLTDIPDAKSNLNAGPLPDGRIYLLSNGCSQGRDPLTLSTSKDGWDFDMSVGVMSCEGFGQCGPRHEGRAKDLGVAYPQGVTVTEPPEMAGFYVAATNNKEDVWVAKIPFDSIPKKNSGACGTRLDTQHSEASCDSGRSFGFHKGNCSMWVDAGCDAEFVCNGEALRCSSHSYGRADCRCAVLPACCAEEVLV